MKYKKVTQKANNKVIYLTPNISVIPVKWTKNCNNTKTVRLSRTYIYIHTHTHNRLLTKVCMFCFISLNIRIKY